MITHAGTLRPAASCAALNLQPTRFRWRVRESIADSADDANLGGFAIHANQHAQGHGALHFHMARFIGVDGGG
jgi:hypothetical protein